MSAYLLDSDVVMDFLNGVEPSTRYLIGLGTDGEDLMLTPVAVAEVFAGTPPPARAAIAAVLARFRSVDLTDQIGQKAGEYRWDFARRGQPLSTPDTLNAAAAQALGATLVTRNRRHFPMADVVIVSPT